MTQSPLVPDAPQPTERLWKSKCSVVDGRDLTKDGVTQLMDGFGAELSPDQITSLLNYVRWLGTTR